MNNTQSSKTIKARHKKAFILCALILAFTLLFTTLASAISSDEAIAIVSVQNNYLRTGESALVLQGLLTYSGDKYLIVAIKKNDTITVYVPIKNSSGEITTRDMETRELIKTAIIYSRMIQKNQETQAANWPFSYSTKSYFEDLANGLSTLKNSAVTVETELDKIDTTETKSLANDAHALKLLAEEFAQSSSIFAQRVDESRKYEQEYFNNPDANKNIKYEEFYRNYFSQAAVIKEDYQNITSKLNALGQAIGALETNQVTIDQKSSFQAILKMPTDAARLPTFFSQNDQFRTEIESIFNESRNSENYATT
ncbi:MAG: hypothetical protein NTY48_03025, partial [Candidatus Diapherotrites archaeon]|nr:hypothetical protein [Candidatus Diapherotrites archaeon]